MSLGCPDFVKSKGDLKARGGLAHVSGKVGTSDALMRTRAFVGGALKGQGANRIFFFFNFFFIHLFIFLFIFFFILNQVTLYVGG